MDDLRSRLREILEDVPADRLPEALGALAEATAIAQVRLLGAGGVGEHLAPVDLTVSAVAAELDRAPSTVRGWLGSGALRGYRLRGREWRVPRAALREFLDGEAGERFPESGSVDLGSWRDVALSSGRCGARP